MTPRLYLGIDGGQTSTKSVLADANGNVLGVGQGSPCDHIIGVHGVDRNRAAIHSAIASVLERTGSASGDIVAVGMALTSAPRELAAQPIFEGILREVLQPESVWIDHDVAGNLAGASAGAPGVVVIAGGGSISYGVDANGNEGKAGGMGYLLGDDGSGWWIGLQAIRAAARAVDGRGPETALLPFVMDHYQLPTIRHIVGTLYGADFTRDKVSVIAKDVARIAQSDPVAAEIMHGAGVLLAEMVLATIGQIHAEGDSVDVYQTGGVFGSGAILLDPFDARLHEGWPNAVIRRPQFAPMYGALFRAWQTGGITVTEGLLHTLRKSIGA